MTDHPPLKAYPSIQGRCPACRGDSLFIGSGGYVTCSRLDCPNSSAADQLLHGESTDTTVDIPADKNGPTIANAQADGGEVVDNEADTETADYDRDPAALAWARAKVQEAVDKAEACAANTDLGDQVRDSWRLTVGFMRRELLTRDGVVRAAFDERWPATLSVWDGGPSVAEATADDRRWFDAEREGE